MVGTSNQSDPVAWPLISRKGYGDPKLSNFTGPLLDRSQSLWIDASMHFIHWYWKNPKDTGVSHGNHFRAQGFCI